ncbi:hypothetical protein PLESTM_000559900 [Pleodorina starrii]|nr:hypothetical protein PLESTM_000559900 [Pleodorina starrii]
MVQKGSKGMLSGSRPEEEQTHMLMISAGADCQQLPTQPPFLQGAALPALLAVTVSSGRCKAAVVEWAAVQQQTLVPGGSGSSSGNGGSGFGHAAGAAGGGIGSDDPASFPELFLLSSSRDCGKGSALYGSLALRRMYPTEVRNLDTSGANSATVQLFRLVGKEQRYGV